MKNTDLRLGNLFIEEYSGEIIKVESISEHSIGFSGNFKSTWQAKPIPITEEWLLKFGFKKVKSSDFGDFEFHKFINGSEYLVWFSDNSMAIGGSKEETNKGLCYCSNCIFQHVHQLQNLYFALTGEELEPKQV